MRALSTLAPAKVNLGLFVGPTREDGRHELVTVMQPISLADKVTLEAGSGAEDEVVCPGVRGENLVARAIGLFREATGWGPGAVRVRIDKWIPVAAGLGGGSADAGAALRLLAVASGLRERSLLLDLAAQLGADVPAQLAPARTLATGAGERLEPLPEPVLPLGVVVLAQARGLSTADVYAAADRLGEGRDAQDLGQIGGQVRTALASGAPLPEQALLANDLQRAARTLSPQIEPALEQAQATGADLALVSGSGPTVLGLFDGAEGPARARRAAAALVGRSPAPVAAETVAGDFAAVVPAGT